MVTSATCVNSDRGFILRINRDYCDFILDLLTVIIEVLWYGQREVFVVLCWQLNNPSSPSLSSISSTITTQAAAIKSTAEQIKAAWDSASKKVRCSLGQPLAFSDFISSSISTRRR